MARSSREPARRVYFVLGCLFLLSLLAPRAWDRTAVPADTEHPASAMALGAPAPASRQGEERDGGEAIGDSVLPLAPTPEVCLARPATYEQASAGPATRAEVVAGPEPDPMLVDVPSALPRLEEAGGRASGPAHAPAELDLPEHPAPLQPIPNGPAESQDPPAPAGSQPAEEDDGMAATARGPESLLDRLDDVLWECETGVWAMEVAGASRRVIDAIEAHHDEARTALAHLNELVEKAPALAVRLGDDPLAGKVRRVEYALRRRLDVWKQAVLLDKPGLQPAAHADPSRLSACLDKVETVTRASSEGHAWRRYLGLDLLRGVTRHQTTLTEGQSQSLARQILHRMGRGRMTEAQRAFLSSEPMVALRTELKSWAVSPVDHREVLRHLEDYEGSGLPSHARVLAEDYQRLGFAPTPEHQELSRRLEAHYRNANLRLVVSADLLNRLMPIRQPEFSWVDDQVMGRPVRGQSVNATNVRVRMIPDAQRLRLALEVNGQVSALTSSFAGPARFHDASQSNYRAWKEVEITTSGIRVWPAQVSVANDIQLRGVDTDFDIIPIFGALAQGIARNQHDQQKHVASREVSRKIEARAKQQIDEEVDVRLNDVSKRLQERVIRPLDELSLDPTMIAAETSENRMVMRLRLASGEQLGAHTPRPQALSDSLASAQIHESMLNNLFEQMGLNGNTFTIAQLRNRLAERFPKAAGEPDPENDDAEITFAKDDAIRVRCDEGQMTLTLSMAALRKAPYHWRDFQVRVHYRPLVRGLSTELVRDGVVELTGDRLNARAQIALRGVFAKTFPKHRTWRLTPEAMLKDVRLADLAITQFVIHDGWIGVAVGPQRAGPNVAQRPTAPLQ